MASTQMAWQERLQRGGPVVVQPGEAKAVRREALALGYAVFEADCTRAKSKSAVLRAIANAVEYPEYFGSDLDALLDCLTTTVAEQTSGALLLLCGLNLEEPGLAPHVPDILDTCFDAAEHSRDQDRVLAYASLP